MTLLHPAVLLVLPPLFWGFYATGRRRLARLPWLRAITSLTVRLLIGGLLVFALAEPQLTRAARGVHVIFLVDRSASVASAERFERDWLASALRRRGADDSASLSTFGALPTWSGPISGLRPPFPAVLPDGTDIAAAIRFGLTTLPPDQASRMVLLSDGRQTSGDALAAAQEAASLGVPVAVVPVQPVRADDVALTSLDVPPYTRAGERITLRATLRSYRSRSVQVVLTINDRLSGQQTLHLRAGDSTFFFAQTVQRRTGVQRFRLRVLAPGDAVARNDVLDTATVVQPSPRVLVLAGDTAASGPLVGALSTAGAPVQVLPAGRAPSEVSALMRFDAVVLADVPASSLSQAALSALWGAIHDGGRGLLVAGGPHGFAAGGYTASPLEALLPVTSVAQGRVGRSNVGIVLLIDKSGSMMDGVRGVSKISMAQQAAIDAVSHLQPQDQYGVLAFDDTTHVVVPFGPVGARQSQAPVRASILALQPFGDTVIYPALRQAARWLFESHAPFKHAVLLTDGQGESAQYLPLIAQMRRNNISLSTIGIGGDAEVNELRQWASLGGGRFYYTADPRDIPRLVVLETRISSGPTRVQGTIGVHQASAAPVLRSLAGRRLPTLGSYNITAARPSAQVILQSDLGDPLLAQWHYGLGTVATWAGGIDGSWARSWLGESAFWSDELRSLMNSAGPRLFRPELSVVGPTVVVGADASTPQGTYVNLLSPRATVAGPSGATRALVLTQDAPGHYRGELPAAGEGVYTVQLRHYDGAVAVQTATGALSVPYPAELVPAPVDASLLDQIAAVGNASSTQRPGDVFSASGLPVHRVPQGIWSLPALLALLLFPLDVALRALHAPPMSYDPVRFGRGC